MKARITHALLKSLKATGKGYDVNDTELPGFAVRVSAQGKPTCYSIRYRTPNGRRQRLKIGSARVLTPAQARDLAQQSLADVVKGEDPQDVKKRLRGIQTLGSFIETEYAPHVLALHKSGGKPTLQRLKSCFGDFWHWPLKDKGYANAILAWRSKRLKEGRTPETCNRDIKSLKAVFAHARRMGFIEEHPLSSVTHLKTDTQAPIRYLSADEDARLIHALDTREERMRHERDNANGSRAKYGYKPLRDLRTGTFVDHLRPMVLLSLHTGIRRGELFGIEWRDVDFEHATLTLRGTITKNGKTRHLPLNTVALGVLRDWQVQTSNTGLVFKSPNSGGRFDNVDVAWRNLLTEAGISDFRWHDLRHDFASKLVMAGVDLNTVRELLGHGNIAMTLRYAHLAPEHKARAVDVLAKGYAYVCRRYRFKPTS